MASRACAALATATLSGSPEWIVSGAAIAVLAVEIATLFLDPAAFRYEPYPSLTAPAISLPLLAVLGLLLVPAAVRP